jgi:hypothetical protein
MFFDNSFTVKIVNITVKKFHRTGTSPGKKRKRPGKEQHSQPPFLKSLKVKMKIVNF